MTTPRAIRAALILSVATTSGAAYYFLSDGGDPDKLDQNLAEATAKLAETGAKLAETGARVADTGSKLKEAVSAWTAMPETVQQVSNTARNPTSVQQVYTEGEHEKANEHTRNTEKESRDHPSNRDTTCHTCSGPRIWFFAEKLRLKRRITPYSDPPRD